MSAKWFGVYDELHVAFRQETKRQREINKERERERENERERAMCPLSGLVCMMGWMSPAGEFWNVHCPVSG